MSGTSRRATGPRVVLRGHSAEINDIEISASREFLYSGDASGILKRWDLAAAAEDLSFMTKGSILSLHPLNSTEIATLNKSGRMEIWDIEVIGSQGSSEAVLEPKADFTTQASGFCKGKSLESDDNKMLVACASSEDGEIDVFCIEDQNRTHTVSLSPGISSTSSRTGLAFCIDFQHGTADQPLLVGGFEDGRLAIWDLRNCYQPLSEKKVFKEPVMAMSMSLSRKLIVAGSAEKSGAVISMNESLDELEIANQLSGPTEGAYGGSILFKPDQKYFACGGWDGNVRTFQTKNLKPISILKYHVNTPSALRFHDDTLISASLDYSIAIWPI